MSVKDSKLYTILGIPTTATESEIKKAYRKLALEHHPDRNPTQGDRFKEISHAYDILGDPQKKEAYDRYGEETERSSAGMNASNDPFQFFQHGHLFGKGPGPKKGKDVVHHLEVSLKTLYVGKTIKLALQKQIICKSCDGKGGKAGSVIKCHLCDGQGITLMYREMGPGMVQQVPVHCSKCNGMGETIPDKDKCLECTGTRVSRERKPLEVHIDPGMKQGDKIVFKDDGDQAPGMIPGDLIIVLEQKLHPVFKREGSDLMCSVDLELVTALTGGQFTINHLDGRTLLAKISQGEVVKPGDVRTVIGEGMPVRRFMDRGNLYIQMNIIFPENNWMESDKFTMIEDLLPARRPMNELTGTVDEIKLTETDFADKIRRQQQAQQTAHDHDHDDHDNHQSSVQCPQQ